MGGKQSNEILDDIKKENGNIFDDINNNQNNNDPNIQNDNNNLNDNKPYSPGFYIDKTSKIDKSTQLLIKKEINTKNSIMNIHLKTIGGSLKQDIRKLYKFKETLGGGKFGSVRIAVRKDDETQKLYAVKSISKKNLTKEDMDDLIREVEIISGLNHPNIIKFYETYHDDFYFHIVMELCTGKDLFDRIVSNGKLTEQKVSQIIYKVLNGISYCHSKGISHRDLKPENILFESNEPDAEVKIIDFGLSRKYFKDQKMHTILGSPYYVAPEVLKGEYDEKCDIWSIGSMTYIMLSGKPPFNGTSNNDIFNKILNNKLVFNQERFKDISNEAIDFIGKCMDKNPEERLSAKDALNHSWFKNVMNDIHNEKYLCNDILANLKNYSSPQKFKKLVFRFISNNISEKELINIRNTFYAIDLEHTGFISVNELNVAFKNVGIEITDEQIKKIIEDISEQNNGKIEYNDFINACINQSKYMKKEKLIKAFSYFDVDNSGFIDVNDIKKAMLRIGKKIINDEEEIQKVISEVNNDKNNPQKISLEMFLNMFHVDTE